LSSSIAETYAAPIISSTTKPGGDSMATVAASVGQNCRGVYNELLAQMSRCGILGANANGVDDSAQPLKTITFADGTKAPANKELHQRKKVLSIATKEKKKNGKKSRKGKVGGLGKLKRSSNI
jgi:hypothetical protein